MPSATRRKTCRRRLSPVALPWSRACSQRRPPCSRRGRRTSWPSMRRPTRPISAGMARDSGSRDQPKRPVRRWRPAPTRTWGAPSRSKRAAGAPARRTSWGQRSALPGRRSSLARSLCASSEKVPPARPRSSSRRPGQMQTARPWTRGQPISRSSSITQGTQGRSSGGRSGRAIGWAAAGRAHGGARSSSRAAAGTASIAARRRTGTSRSARAPSGSAGVTSGANGLFHYRQPRFRADLRRRFPGALLGFLERFPLAGPLALAPALGCRRSGSSALPASRFHLSKTSGEISPRTSSSANFLRCALLLMGMQRRISPRSRPARRACRRAIPSSPRAGSSR